MNKLMDTALKCEALVFQFQMLTKMSTGTYQLIYILVIHDICIPFMSEPKIKSYSFIEM